MSHQQGEHEITHSLAPVPLEGGSFDARELSQLQDGSGRRLLLMIAAVAALALGGMRWLEALDERQAYATAAAQLAQSDGEPKQAFLRCALPGSTRQQLAEPQQQRAQLERMTEAMQRSYGSLLARCAPLLTGFRHATQDVTAPAAVKGQVSDVAMAASELAMAWTALQQTLQRPEASYDGAQITPLLDKIEGASRDYTAALAEARRALREQH